jgi:hypoxia up-regulated 1
LVNFKIHVRTYKNLYSLSSEANLAAMSIDLGSEYMKIGLVKPGVPMEIVLNKESRRKTPTIVALRNGERFFGDVAAQIVRFLKYINK